MLTLPPKGINVLSIPPPSADAPSESNSGKQPRQLMFITLNDQILSQILATGGKGLSVTFGGSNAVSSSVLISIPFPFLYLIFLPISAFTIVFAICLV